MYREKKETRRGIVKERYKKKKSRDLSGRDGRATEMDNQSLRVEKKKKGVE